MAMKPFLAENNPNCTDALVHINARWLSDSFAEI